MNRNFTIFGLIPLMIVMVTACAPSSLANTPTTQSTISIPPTPSQAITPNIIPVTNHSMMPADSAPAPGELIYDVESSGTASEQRAPYGDSYKINRFERPFLEDMTYVPDMDIVSFSLSQDEDWYYISIGLVGNNPNNSIEIYYGVEIDLNRDSFGDYIVWAHPPYTSTWDTSTVQVFEDSNLDSGGTSVSRSEVVLDGDGYDTLVFDGGSGQENADPDLAWVRVIEDQNLIQFAFKKSLIGSSFMLGVVSDAGLRDVSQFDYNDRFEESDAGSPVRNKQFYPLGSLYAVDNTCWEDYGIEASEMPKSCPVTDKPSSKPSEDGPVDERCTPTFDPAQCGPGNYNPDTCQCK